MENFLQLNKKEYKRLTCPLKQISYIQKQFAINFPFENIDVLLHNEREITQSFLMEKPFKNKRGGLCYELNGALHLVLKKMGFDVYLGVATVWLNDAWTIDRTHTVNLFNHKGETYLIDSGSGTNLSLHPLRIDGESVTTQAGTFRARRKETDRGTVISERLTKDGWMLRYAFYLTEVGWEDLQRIKELIHFHPESPFNENLLIARLTENGTVSITNKRLKETLENGTENKQKFNSYVDLLLAAKQYVSKATYEATMQYITLYNRKVDS